MSVEGLVHWALVLIFCVLLFHSVKGGLTETPQNVVVLRGQDAILNCSADAAGGKNPIWWYHDNDIIVSPPCAPHNDKFITTLPDATTGCNIRALASYGHGISGPYKCSDIITTHAVAMVIVHDPPVCEVAQPVVEGRNVTLMCRMTYDWQAPARQFITLPKLNVSLTWTDTSGTTVKTMTTTADRTTFSATIESNMTIEEVMLRTIPSYRCTIQFDFSNENNPYIQYAVNSVSSQPCVTRPTTVWYCPRSVKIVSNGTLNAGDIVTCTSDSNPEPTYTWTDSNGDVVFTGASITLSGNHDKLTCTATSTFTPECNASTTIYNVTAISGKDDDDGGLPLAVIGGIVAGVVGLLLLILIIVIVVRCRRRRTRKNSSRLHNDDSRDNIPMTDPDLDGQTNYGTSPNWDDESELDLGDGTSQLSSVTPSASSNYNNNRSNGLPRLKVSDEDDYAEVVSGPGREPRPHHTPVAQPNREANYVAIDHRANKLNQQRPDA